MIRVEPSRPAPARRARAVGAVAATALVLAATTALAAPAHAEQTSWLRLGHLSPETPEVDVYFAPSSGGDEELILPKVAYGNLSDYLTVAPGDYTVAMRAAGADPDSTPVVVVNVRAEADAAHTLAVFGEPDALSGNFLTDELTAPEDDTARIRLIQASADSRELDVTAMDGPTIATSAEYGSATGYADVAAGPWTIEVSPDGDSAEAVDIDLPGGTVNSLLVLDDGTGGFDVVPITDAEGMPRMPSGGVETGAGGGASLFTGPAPWALAGATALVLAAVAVAVRRPAGRAAGRGR